MLVGKPRPGIGPTQCWFSSILELALITLKTAFLCLGKKIVHEKKGRFYRNRTISWINHFQWIIYDTYEICINVYIVV